MQISESTSRRLSGTLVEPRFGSMVQNGKLALWAFPELTQLKRVDLPTFGRPTIPHFRDIESLLFCAAKVRKFYNFRAPSEMTTS